MRKSKKNHTPAYFCKTHTHTRWTMKQWNLSSIMDDENGVERLKEGMKYQWVDLLIQV